MSDPLWGVDVSHWRGTVNWPQAHAAGVGFAFAKVTEGTGYVDPTWEANRAGMHALGSSFLPGGYHFLRGDMPIPAQVTHFLEQAGDVSGLAVALDVETRKEATRQANRAMAYEWVAEFKTATGGHPVLGYYPQWYHNTYQGDLSFFDTLWASHYIREPGPMADLYAKVPESWWAPYGGETVSILQFSSSATVSGVNPPTDVNAYRGPLDELRALLLPEETPVPLSPELKAELNRLVGDCVPNTGNTTNPSIALRFAVRDIRDEVRALTAKVDALPEPVPVEFDLDAIADKVADRLAARLAQ